MSCVVYLINYDKYHSYMWAFRRHIFNFSPIFDFQASFDAVDIAFRIVRIFCASIWASLYCYFAAFATQRISSTGDSVYKLIWFNYPLGIQKSLVLLIAQSHRPMDFTGLKIVHCSLEALGRVRIFRRKKILGFNHLMTHIFFCSFSNHLAPSTFSSEVSRIVRY